MDAAVIALQVASKKREIHWERLICHDAAWYHMLLNILRCVVLILILIVIFVILMRLMDLLDPVPRHDRWVAPDGIKRPRVLPLRHLLSRLHNIMWQSLRCGKILVLLHGGMLLRGDGVPIWNCRRELLDWGWGGYLTMNSLTKQRLFALFFNLGLLCFFRSNLCYGVSRMSWVTPIGILVDNSVTRRSKRASVTLNPHMLLLNLLLLLLWLNFLV